MARSILMLEHDDDDRYITQRVFGEQRFDVTVNFAASAQEFFQELELAATQGALPSLILVNYYNKPVNGVDILKQVKSDSRFRQIPVVMLGGTVKQEIIDECYRHGANSFIQKPASAVDTDEKIRNFFKYWFETVHLP